MSDDTFEPPRYAPPRTAIPAVSNPQEDTVSVVNWRELDPPEIEPAWRALDEWVTWLIHRYTIPVEVIADCWWRHGGVVEELSALHTCWLACFHPEDSGFGPIGFHERLDAARQRLTNAACNSSHFEPKTRPLKRDQDEWAAWITGTHQTSSSPADGTNEGETNE